MNWETVTPEWWVPKGYAAVRVDGRGSGKSPGQCEPWSLAEAIDFYDAIEWAAAQPWCNGKVGLSGISYFAINQWFVANLQPPSLKAIMPWEGFADIYRDALFHGGILSVFMTNWFTAHTMHHVMGRAAQTCRTAGRPTRCGTGCTTTSTAARCAARRRSGTRSPCRCSRSATGPASALHLRGNTEAFMRAASKHKKLRIHNGSHVHPFYTEEGKRDQLRFFDYWLKGIDNGVMDEPPVKLAIRKGKDEIEWRARARMAARAHAMDEILFRRLQGGGRPGAARRRAGEGEAGEGQLLHLSGVQPRHHGLDLGRLVAGDGRRHQARHGHRAGDAAADRGRRGHRAARRDASRCRARARTWTCS